MVEGEGGVRKGREGGEENRESGDGMGGYEEKGKG